MATGQRLLVKITRESLPQVKDKYPFIYLERGRLEVDDSSVKWIDADNHVVPLPVATLNALLLGPGTTVTHEAIKAATAANCPVCWVGEDSLLFYAAGFLPTADTRNLKLQITLSADPVKSLEVARRMFARRFPDADLAGKTLPEMMGMEGHRVRSLYEEKAQHYQVGWKGRSFTPGKFEASDLTNQILTTTNAALYGILSSALHSMGYSPHIGFIHSGSPLPFVYDLPRRCGILSSALHSMGYSPHIGFIHSGSPLPFVYDLADLYKEELCIDLAFALTRDLAGRYDKHKVAARFRERVIDMDLLAKVGDDVIAMLGTGRAHRYRK